MSSEEITIRSVQHYLYCPHRWGLLEIERAWAENFFVTRANLLHERVHDPEANYTSGGKKVFTSVPVYNDREEYNLYGVADTLELTEDPRGVYVNGSKEKYRICIVEYKPTKPKGADYRWEDLMQVFAQKICADHIFRCDCDTAIYYGDVRKRVMLPLSRGGGQKELSVSDRSYRAGTREEAPAEQTRNGRFDCCDSQLRSALAEMRRYLAEGRVPEIRKGQKCSGCSMKDLCMPSVRRNGDLRMEIKEIMEADQGNACEGGVREDGI